MSAAASPLSAVLKAIESGAGSVDVIASRTGMSSDTVQASLDHLRRMGRLDARELAMGCPGGGCASCAMSHGDGTPGCGSGGCVVPGSGPRRPVLIELTLRRPR